MEKSDNRRKQLKMLSSKSRALGGWMDGWMDVGAGLRIAYSNQLFGKACNEDNKSIKNKIKKV